ASHGRLAAAGFADEREGLAAVYLEADAVDRLEPAPPAPFDQPIEDRRRHLEPARQIVEAEERRGVSHAASITEIPPPRAGEGSARRAASRRNGWRPIAPAPAARRGSGRRHGG